MTSTRYLVLVFSTSTWYPGTCTVPGRIPPTVVAAVVHMWLCVFSSVKASAATVCTVLVQVL